VSAVSGGRERGNKRLSYHFLRNGASFDCVILSAFDHHHHVQESRLFMCAFSGWMRRHELKLYSVPGHLQGPASFWESAWFATCLRQPRITRSDSQDYLESLEEVTSTSCLSVLG
jgi:hypothetical protein